MRRRAGRWEGQWEIDPSGMFGGAYMPKRFQCVTTLGVALGRKRQRAFDAAHPYPEGVQRWKRQRRALQAEGSLPPEAAQSEPTYAQVYLDDGAGAALNAAC